MGIIGRFRSFLRTSAFHPHVDPRGNLFLQSNMHAFALDDIGGVTLVQFEHCSGLDIQTVESVCLFISLALNKGHASMIADSEAGEGAGRGLDQAQIPVAAFASGNRSAVRALPGVAQEDTDAVNQTGRDHVLEFAGVGFRLINLHAQHVVDQALGQPVLAYKLAGAFLAFRGQGHPRVVVAQFEKLIVAHLFEEGVVEFVLEPISPSSRNRWIESPHFDSGILDREAPVQRFGGVVTVLRPSSHFAFQ